LRSGVLRLSLTQLEHQRRQSSVFARRPKKLDCHLPAFDKAGLAKALAERIGKVPERAQ
jgi:hypothetical protein